MPIGATKFGLMAAAGAGGAGETVAFGGIMNEYTTGGTTYRFHVFRSDGKFEVVGSDDLSLTLLIVGGGGSASPQWEAGGGGGGAQIPLNCLNLLRLQPPRTSIPPKSPPER